MRKEMIILLSLVIFSMFLLGCASNAPPPVPETKEPAQKAEVNALAIYHWWTSSSEASAVNALVDVFSKEYPNVAIMSAPVKGGNVDFHAVVLQPMVLNGEAPDSFQGHPGYEVKPYYDSETLETVDDIWASENLEEVIPKVIQDINKFKGNYYSIPIGIHRNNVVWYNKKLLDENGIDPTKLTDWDSFFAACDKLREAGIQDPIVQGEAWTAIHVFETILGSQGPQFYEDWMNGKITSADDPRMISALETFKRFLSYTNADSATVGWNDAVGRVIKGEGAFNVMGDWANGEFKIVGMKYNLDYGTFPVPGTTDEYIMSVDTFVRPRGTAHPTNSIRWLEVVASKAGQDAFNPKKGSISARIDSDISLYDDYQKAAIQDFKSVKYYFPSRGTGIPASYVSELNNIMSVFVEDKDSSKAAKAMAELTKQTSSDFITVWSFT
ncbi:carbohydrate ABC transporter substrate-binding protein [Candidatus Woesearchaeota archaeon]|nr:carbohydrate ABC transporter substrate-binding protein [Candidatus Woesearchaeota archaeon]